MRFTILDVFAAKFWFSSPRHMELNRFLVTKFQKVSLVIEVEYRLLKFRKFWTATEFYHVFDAILYDFPIQSVVLVF